MTMVGEELGGRYRLDSLLGAGGMATVYRARDLRLERDVAVKVLSPNLAADETLAARFEQEARFLAALSHPAIVAVHDVGEEAGEPYFVMELVEGESLADRLAREGALAPGVLVPILSTVAEGLASLHERGFVHRDVKPHNILIAEGGRAKLADFGLVRSEERASDLTAPGTTVGTLAYLAPELLRGEPGTPASDVYALGVVAYEGLTGRLPYPVETLAGLVESQVADPPPQSALVPGLGEAFDGPIRAALGSPAGRPAAAEFGAALEAASQVAGGGVPAPTLAPVVAGDPAVDEDAETRLGIEAVATDAPSAVWAGGLSPRATDRPAASARDRSLARRLGVALVGLFVTLLLFGLTGALGDLLPFGPGASGGLGASGSPKATGTARASGTPPATPSGYAAVSAALRDYRAELERARGGSDGLKGKEANELADRAAKVEEAVADRDVEEARDAAAELRQKTEEIAGKELKGERASALISAARAVDAAARRLPQGD